MLSSSSVSTEQSCADGTPLSARSPSLFQLNTWSERSSPARFKVYPQSESCGSSPASGSMELDYEMFPTVSMDTRRRILLALYNTKFAKRGDDQWRATDPSVLTKVQGFLKVVDTYLTIDDVKEHVIALENDVKLDMSHVKYISKDRDTYFAVFNYVVHEYVQDSHTKLVATDNEANESPRGKKMKMTCNAESSTNSGKSDSSIGEHFSKLMEDKETALELFKGPLSMKNCSVKARRCAFKGKELRCVLNLLRLNWEHRQIFMDLEDSEAKDYALEAIYGFVPPPLPPPTQ